MLFKASEFWLWAPKDILITDPRQPSVLKYIVSLQRFISNIPKGNELLSVQGFVDCTCPAWTDVDQRHLQELSPNRRWQWGHWWDYSTQYSPFTSTAFVSWAKSSTIFAFIKLAWCAMPCFLPPARLATWKKSQIDVKIKSCIAFAYECAMSRMVLLRQR